MELMNLFAEKEWGLQYREWTCGHSGGKKEWMNGESIIDIYTLSHIKVIAGEKLLYNTGTPAWRSVMT